MSTEIELKNVNTNDNEATPTADSPKENYEKGSNEEKSYPDDSVAAKNEKEETPVSEPDGTMNNLQFAINIMKGIAGTGSLTIPNAIYSVGILPALGLFVAVTLLYIYTSYILITIQETMKKRKNIGQGVIRTNNDYARICYVALGMPGYYIFNFAVLLTMYGAAIGTMIVMTDFLTSLPVMTQNPELKRTIMQIILTVLAIVLCLLKDPSLLVTISSFGLFALVISFILLFIYGVSNFSFSFKRAYLFPLSASDFLNKIGIYIYSLGFTLFLLSQLKYVKRSCRPFVTKTISVSVTIMAIIYAIIGLCFFLLFAGSPKGVTGNILAVLPETSFYNVIVSVLMVVTCIGSFPLYLSPTHEVIEGGWGEPKTNRYFITSPRFVVFRVVETILVSVVAKLVPSFSAILGFNILRRERKVS